MKSQHRKLGKGRKPTTVIWNADSFCLGFYGTKSRCRWLLFSVVSFTEWDFYANVFGATTKNTLFIRRTRTATALKVLTN